MLTFDDVTVVYKNVSGQAKTAIDGISLRIRPGEFVTIMGANGSGKTTFARLCNGLIFSTSGNVCVDDVAVRPDDPKAILEIRRRVGMVFQNPDHQFVSTTVEREIAFGLENLGIEREVMRARVAEMLACFDLESARMKAPHQLSGGQKQRLAIASVLVMQPRYLIFDEPAAVLDMRHRRALMQAMLDLFHHTSTNTPHTLINITQHPEEALFSNRLIVLHQGKIALDGPPEKLLLQEDTLARFDIRPPVEFSAFIRLKKNKFPLTSVDELFLSPIL